MYQIYQYHLLFYFQVFDSIKRDFGVNTAYLLNKVKVAGGSSVSFVVDSTIETFTVKIRGDKPSVTLKDPFNSKVSYTKVTSITNLLVISVDRTKPGSYMLNVNGMSNTTWEVTVTGKSTFNIKYGYGLKRDTPLCETYRKPVRGKSLR